MNLGSDHDDVGNALLVLDDLPLVGSTLDVNSTDSLEYWRSVFGAIWGPVKLTEVGMNPISGQLHSRQVGNLTFNRITWGNQIFECVDDGPADGGEPFFSLTFPQRGVAECYVGQTQVQLVPNHAYLINVNSTAKLRVDQRYTTVNIQIPVSSLEHRLGRQIEIVPRGILRPDPIYHLILSLTAELLQHANDLDDKTTSFLTDQMLDSVAFFLANGNEESAETAAVQSVRARVLAYLDANFHDSTLSPVGIAAGCGVSRSYLYKIFSDGPTVMDHLRLRRLEAARKMIGMQPKTVTLTSVAMACGFTNSSEFSRLFKKEFGVRPSDY